MRTTCLTILAITAFFGCTPVHGSYPSYQKALAQYAPQQCEAVPLEDNLAPETVVNCPRRSHLGNWIYYCDGRWVYWDNGWYHYPHIHAYYGHPVHVHRRTSRRISSGDPPAKRPPKMKIVPRKK